MNKSLIIVIGIVIVAGLGAFAYFNLSSEEVMPLDPASEGTQLAGSPESQQDNGMVGGDAQVPQDARYVEYSQETFAQASDKKRVLFFYAAWCPTCRPADAEFSEKSSQIPEDVVLFRTDYDTEDALKDKYDITYQHTYVLVDENGNEIEKWNGGAFDELISRIQ